MTTGQPPSPTIFYMYCTGGVECHSYAHTSVSETEIDCKVLTVMTTTFFQHRYITYFVNFSLASVNLQQNTDKIIASFSTIMTWEWDSWESNHTLLNGISPVQNNSPSTIFPSFPRTQVILDQSLFSSRFMSWCSSWNKTTVTSHTVSAELFLDLCAMISLSFRKCILLACSVWSSHGR